MSAGEVSVRVHGAISDIGREAWDACAAPFGNPFVSYDFLWACEESGCVAPRQGWAPRHLSVEDDAGGYRSVLAGVKALLMADFGVTHVEPPRGMMEEPASSTGFKLPMFPGFNPPVERVLS